MCTFSGVHNKFNGETLKMKRTTLISASLLLAIAGCTCGSGRLPNIFTRMNNSIHGRSNVGEACDAGCQGATGAGHAANGGCDTCGSVGSVNYGGYEQVGDSYEVQSGTPYTVGPSTTYVQPSYTTGQPTPSRVGETIRPKPAN